MAKCLRTLGLWAFCCGLVFGTAVPVLADGKAVPDKAKVAVDSGFGSLDEPTQTINRRLKEAWEANKITPAERCSDYEFIRRASLDIIGRIATVAEIHTFMKDPQSVRRELLVDRLLKSPEYKSNWSKIWTYWLMTRTGPRLYKDQIELWLDEYFEQETISIKDMADKLLTATGKTNDNGAVNFALANLGGLTAGQARNAQASDDLLKKEGRFDMVPLTSRSVRLFLGYQIQCTQCHDHPFNADWKQKHFWGVNAFFRQTDRLGGNPLAKQKKGMAPPILELQDNTGFNTSGVIFFEKRTGVFMSSQAVFLDNTALPKNNSVPRRQILAQFMTAHKNFSKAYVNRMWAHLFSRGMNAKPAFDDFGEHNEVVHEELLGELGEAFTKANYNPKTLIRWITASDAYNLRAVANNTNDTPEAEPYMSRQMLKAMSPEQLFESLMVATQRPTDGKAREDWIRRLSLNFGDDEGNEINFSGTVVQALLMMNGSDLNGAIGKSSGTVEAAMKKKGKDQIDHLFLATLNRPATAKEVDDLRKKMRVIKDADGSGPLQDIFWALLNCNEFFLNH